MKRKKTQKERILAALQPGTKCGAYFLEEHMPRYAARINELRNDGWIIETRRCPQHPTLASYELLGCVFDDQPALFSDA